MDTQPAFKNLYPSRFDQEYLSGLADLLEDMEGLKKTALHESKEFGGITYNRCISINFCGLSASTLLNPRLDHPEMVNSIQGRIRVAAAFKHLFSKEFIERLNPGDDIANNPNRYFLRVRLGFSYLFTDYPVCLMKAEQEEIWERRIDKVVEDFIPDPPLTTNQYRGTAIKSSQKDSLEALFHLLKDAKGDFAFNDEQNAVHTLDLKFSIIPSPVCILSVNNRVFCEPYLYDKIRDNMQQSLVCPVNVFEDTAVPEEEPEKNKRAYDGTISHFKYIWFHDLTLPAERCTAYRPGHLVGLLKIVHPEEIAHPQRKNWLPEEKTIRQRLTEKAEKENQPLYIDEKQVEGWRECRDEKFFACTRKVEEGMIEGAGHLSVADPGGTVHLKIGMRKEFFFFNIHLPGTNWEVEYCRPDANVLYCALAHYGFAVSNGMEENTFFLQHLKNRRSFRSQCEKIIRNHNLSKNDEAVRIIFETLFKGAGDHLEFRLTAAQVDFDKSVKDKIACAIYPLIKKASFPPDIPLEKNKKNEDCVSCLYFPVR